MQNIRTYLYPFRTYYDPRDAQGREGPILSDSSCITLATQPQSVEEQMPNADDPLTRARIYGAMGAVIFVTQPLHHQVRKAAASLRHFLIARKPSLRHSARAFWFDLVLLLAAVAGEQDK